jgi:putative ABC transport system substrate-binding protein
MQFSPRPFLCGGVLLFGFCWSLLVKAETLWIALSNEDPVYLEAVASLRAELPNVSLRVADWRDLNVAVSPPRLLVTVGSEALGKLKPAAGKTRIVAMLTPRSTLDAASADAAGLVTGIYSEQSFAQQAAFLRAAFPNKTRVGMVLGPSTARYRNELVRQLRRVGMEAVIESIQTQSEMPAAMQTVLAACEVFLAVPDAQAINNQTAKFILLSSYRQNVPVVGYSASFVRAGAALAMVSSPAQIGKEAALMVKEALAGKLQPPRSPQAFEIRVNTNVARSLSLDLDADALTRRLGGEGAAR